MRKQKLIKLYDGECHICGENKYELLDVHRIVPGRDGGTYNLINGITLCVMCHRKVETQIIKIIGRYPSTLGYRLLLIEEDGVQRWIHPPKTARRENEN